MVSKIYLENLKVGTKIKMNIETRIRKYFKKDISHMLFSVLSVMLLTFIVLNVFQLVIVRNPFLNELLHNLDILTGFFMVVSAIGIVVMEIIF
ncbi:hypothetical protein [Methanococcus maripaludis]|uniref:Uncharacterized protein n=2 Tax=Methanococcus maripaludis TaxID=39152 RepID=A0A7J9PFL4_METMI|nr:hypothetical protein [Methanococcus maripaludis]MBA2862052.1 hypothetical protein [Methanococcus maripaludis]